MVSEQHHEDLVKGLYYQLKLIFDSSDQAIYLYLDDVHKVCNKKFASLLGYNSPDEWAKIEVPLDDVEVKSQPTIVSAYQNAMEKMIGSTFDVTWKRKDGRLVRTNVMLIPISYQEHLFALHFVSEKKK